MPTWTPVPTWTPIVTSTHISVSVTVVVSGTSGVTDPPEDWGSGLGVWDVIALIVNRLFDFFMALLTPIIDVIYFLMWLITKIVELITALLRPLWWAFDFILTLLLGIQADIEATPAVAPLELGDFGTGYNFARELLASTPFAVVVYLVNALLWFVFIRWAIAQFSNLT